MAELVHLLYTCMKLSFHFGLVVDHKYIMFKKHCMPNGILNSLYVLGENGPKYLKYPAIKGALSLVTTLV